jgi:hypothetical protein
MPRYVFGCGAKNLALLQNQFKPSQLEKLINHRENSTQKQEL